MNIMVIDDEPDIELLFKQKFRREIRQHHLNFSFFFSAEQALDYLSNNNDHQLVLILADINMPGMNGLELLRILKQRYAHLKVFMITAYGDEKNHQTALEYGADGYLTKPLKFDGLKERISDLLGN